LTTKGEGTVPTIIAIAVLIASLPVILLALVLVAGVFWHVVLDVINHVKGEGDAP